MKGYSARESKVGSYLSFVVSSCISVPVIGHCKTIYLPKKTCSTKVQDCPYIDRDFYFKILINWRIALHWLRWVKRPAKGNRNIALPTKSILSWYVFLFRIVIIIFRYVSSIFCYQLQPNIAKPERKVSQKFSLSQLIYFSC